MKRILSLMILLLILASTNANAWFFFIPGSVTGAIADAVTGSEGSHCVGINAKVGDVIGLPGGGKGTVKSLSGTSMRCTQPELPIRALIDVSNSLPPTALSPITNKTSFDPPTPVVTIQLPDGTWGEPVPPPVENPLSVVVETPAPPNSSDGTSSSSSPSQSVSPAQKLRELNALFREGLIDKKEYAEKKGKFSTQCDSGRKRLDPLIRPAF